MDRILTALQQGLPVLVEQFAVTLALLGAGIVCYMILTPFNEWRLVRQGNVAAGIVIAGTLVALSIPLAATLAVSVLTLDILLWGIVALAIQLATFVAATVLIRGLRAMIEGGNIAAALVLIGIQIAVALLNAGAMSG
jgi:putative membrane protein